MNETPKKKSKWRWVLWICLGLAGLAAVIIVGSVLLIFVFPRGAGVERPHNFFKYARFGPDNNTLVFNFCLPPERQKPCIVATYNIVTGKTRRFEGMPPNRLWGEASYSPDGKMIVVNQINESPLGGRYVLLNTSSRTYRTVSGCGSLRGRAEPRFSPDGRWIYFIGALTDEELKIDRERKSDERGRPGPFSFFRLNIETGEEERILDKNKHRIPGLFVSRFGLHYTASVYNDLGDYTHDAPAFTSFANFNDEVLYDVKADPFFSIHKKLFEHDKAPGVSVEGAAEDGSVLVNLAAADGPDGYQKYCPTRRRFAYNLFILHPERETRQLTKFKCAYFNHINGGMSRDGSRVLMSRRSALYLDDPFQFFVINGDGTGLREISLPKNLDAYKPVQFSAE